jgi:hypothetical protein
MGGLRGTLTGWIAAALLLCAACDLVENRKFSPADFGDNGGGYYTGLGGYTGAGSNGPGGSSTRVSLDAGGYGGGKGFGGAGGFAVDAGNPCGIDQSGGCIQSCYSVNAPIFPATCDPSSRSYYCANGAVTRYQCPLGSCGSVYQYCCDTSTGVLSVPFCNSSGYLNGCSDNSQYVMQPVCIPSQAGGVSDCQVLNGSGCSSAGIECESGSSRCYCDGQTYRWSCTSTSGGLGVP